MAQSLTVPPPGAPLTLLLVEPPDEAAVAVGLEQQLLEELPQVDGLPGAGRVHFAVRPALLTGRGWAAGESGREWGVASRQPPLVHRPQSPGPSLPCPAHRSSEVPQEKSSLSSRPLQDKEKLVGTQERSQGGRGGHVDGTEGPQRSPYGPGFPIAPSLLPVWSCILEGNLPISELGGGGVGGLEALNVGNGVRTAPRRSLKDPR